MIKRMTAVGMAMVGMAASLLIPSTAHAAADEYRIDVLSWTGTGCKYGVPMPEYDDNHKIFNLVYPDFKVHGNQGPKSCQLRMRIHVPAGLSAAIYQVTNRGMGYLQDKRIRARQTVNLWYAGGTETAKKYTDFYGPLGDNEMADSWSASMGLEGQWLWSPCGGERTMYLKNDLQIQGPYANYMQLEDTDMNVSTQLYLRDMTCGR